MVFDQVESTEPREKIHARLPQHARPARPCMFGEALRVLAQSGSASGHVPLHGRSGPDGSRLRHALESGRCADGDHCGRLHADGGVSRRRVLRVRTPMEPEVDPADYTVEAYRARNCPPEVMLDTLGYLEERVRGSGSLRSFGGRDGRGYLCVARGSRRLAASHLGAVRPLFLMCGDHVRFEDSDIL